MILTKLIKYLGFDFFNAVLTIVYIVVYIWFISKE